MLIDTHCHLDDKRYDTERALVLKRAKQAGIQKLITIGCSLENSLRTKDLAIVHDFIFFSAGIHPYNASYAPKGFIDDLAKIASHKKCVAIGECGLDYYYENSSPKAQKEVFAAQIKLASKLNKALVVHVRDAWEDCLNMLQRYKPASPVVIHCFTGSLKNAQKCVDLGYYISLPGVLTFKNAGDLLKVAKLISLDKIIIETDAPYLAPVPYRGKRNEPAFVVKVAEKIAEIKEVELEKVVEITGKNGQQIFSLFE